MRRWIASLAGMLAAGALVLSGCGSPDAGGHHDHATSPSATATAKHNAADVVFAQMMVPHHRQAVQMADMADGKAGPKVAKLATAIKRTQRPEIAKMSGWLKAWGEKPGGNGMGHGMDHGAEHGDGMMSGADMKKLRGRSGAAFDRKFLTMMIEHHRGAVRMATIERTGGTYAPATSMAASMITAQKAEITKMRGMLKSG